MRPKSFFINGGAGRVLCSIPAFEKYAEDHPDEDFVIVCEGGVSFWICVWIEDDLCRADYCIVFRNNLEH